jgi:hypothetical protein
MCQMTDKQLTRLQEDAMQREQCDRVLLDKMTGKRFDRTELLHLLVSRDQAIPLSSGDWIGSVGRSKS